MTALQTPAFGRKAGQVPTTAATPAVAATEAHVETRAARAARYVFAGVRIALGWVFLWAFLDKLFGLGHATPAKGAWINGGNPTKGFLANGAAGPFADLYHNIAGAGWANWLFMLGLLGIGVALITGVGIRVAAVAGTALLVLMFTVVLPPENNVFMDDHLIYAGTLVGLALTNAGDTLGLGRIWGALPLVRKNPWLR
jgi:thiosulfate dehydrogenase [quinone] large subunit